MADERTGQALGQNPEKTEGEHGRDLAMHCPKLDCLKGLFRTALTLSVVYFGF